VSVKIIATQDFARRLKKLIKKYKSLKREIATLQQSLQSNPTQGTPLGNNAFKVRVAVKSKGKGKSGGLRVISYFEVAVVVDQEDRLFMLTIYDKSDTEAISKEEIKQMIDKIEH
jgi:hypothetical protein